MSAKVHSSKIVYQGKVFKLLREHVTLDNGVTTDLDLIDHPGASAIVALSNENKVLLLKQYRHALGNFIWEIPAGTLDPKEEPLDCAKRELIEETGFAAHSWEKLGEITPVPGCSNERIHAFLASRLNSAVQNLDKDEVLQVHEVDLKDAMGMVYDGLIQDGKTISGLFMATHWLTRKNRSLEKPND